MSEAKENRSLYRELCEPFENEKEANESIEAFFKELGELRKKHGLPNVYVVIAFSYKGDDGECQYMLNAHYGDSLMRESMAAYALGCEQADRQQMIGQLLARGLKKGPKKQ